MKRLTPKITVLAAVVLLSLLTGYSVRYATHSSNVEKHESVATPDPPGQQKLTGRDQDRNIEQLKHTLELADGPVRWLELVSAIEGASVDELPRMAMLVAGDEVALEILAIHWVDLNPRHMFEILQQRSRRSEAGTGRFPTDKLAKHLFSRWPKIDPDAAIAALSAPDGIAKQYSFRGDVFKAVMEQDPERGIGLIGKWGTMYFTTPTESIRKWAAQDPQRAAEVVLANSSGPAAGRCAKVIAETWVKEDPQAAMDFTISRKDRLGSQMAETAFKDWVKRDFDAAALWLEKQEDASRLSPHIIEAWAKKDMHGALTWCQENLSGAPLTQAFEKLASGAASKNVNAAAKMVSEMEPSPARVRAAVAVAKQWFPTSMPSPKRVTPEAINWLRNLDDPKAQGEILDAISWGWSMQDREGLKAFLSEPAAAEAPDYSFFHIAEDWAMTNPQEAFEWAEQLPVGRSERIAEHVFETWSRQQPEAATAWLRDLPQSDPRRPSIVYEVARSIVRASDAVATQRMQGLKPADLETIKTLRLTDKNMQRFIEALQVE